MIHHRILDWDDAYANTPNIPGGERYPELWVEPAQSFRTDLLAKGRARQLLPTCRRSSKMRCAIGRGGQRGRS